jgi:hypothetical protein
LENLRIDARLKVCYIIIKKGKRKTPESSKVAAIKLRCSVGKKIHQFLEGLGNSRSRKEEMNFQRILRKVG